jgi:hypothetical protein
MLKLDSFVKNICIFGQYFCNYFCLIIQYFVAVQSCEEKLKDHINKGSSIVPSWCHIITALNYSMVSEKVLLLSGTKTAEMAKFAQIGATLSAHSFSLNFFPICLFFSPSLLYEAHTVLTTRSILFHCHLIL